MLISNELVKFWYVLHLDELWKHYVMGKNDSHQIVFHVLKKQTQETQKADQAMAFHWWVSEDLGMWMDGCGDPLEVTSMF